MANLKNTRINTTQAIKLPEGNNAQRPSSANLGMMRYNTEEEIVEVYNGTEWIAIASGAGSLYEFVTATFTPGGSSGSSGPSLSEARNGLSGTGTNNWKNNTEFFDTSNGIQLWTVPQDGTYRIEAYGASGGAGDRSPGRGARMRGDFTLTAGDKIKILIGQEGRTTGEGANGGGGTFVATFADTPLIVAGAGGGGAGNNPFDDGKDAITSETNSNTGSSGQGGAADSGNSNERGDGGGGFFGNGGSVNGNPGISFVNGGEGNSGTSFGGGGGQGSDGAGGGGGYSGGDGNDRGGGFGGGSFNSGSNQSNSSGVRSGDGQVTITLL